MNSKLLHNLNSSSHCASWEFMRQCENGNIWLVSEWVRKSIERSNYENICNAFKLSSNTFQSTTNTLSYAQFSFPYTMKNVHFLILSTSILKKVFSHHSTVCFPVMHLIQTKRTVCKNSENSSFDARELNSHSTLYYSRSYYDMQ